MIAELQAQPAKGLLGMHAWAGWRQTLIVQYWRSFEHLERFARDPDATHHPEWRRFNQLIGGDGTVGIWHETYQVEPGSFETVYRQYAFVWAGCCHGACSCNRPA